MVSNGVSGACKIGVGMLCGMEAIGCVRGGFVVEGVLVAHDIGLVAHDIGLCSRRSGFLCMHAMRGA